MYLRYEIDGMSEIATITHMYYSNGKAYFKLEDGRTLIADGIAPAEWNRVCADIFSDGKLSLVSMPSVTTKFIKYNR